MPMSANRRAWVLVGLVVAVVAVLVVRTMRNDARVASERSAAMLPPERVPPKARPVPDSLRSPGGKQISAVQRAKIALKAKGYYDGPINGDYDQSVADAVKRFQKDAGMEQNGYLNERTYTALGIQVRGRR